MTVIFISRKEARADEVTVRIYTDAGAVLGEVTCPEGLAGSHTAAELDHDGALGVHQALASAITLAEAHHGRVSIVDEEGMWRPEWGDLVKRRG